MYKKARAGEIPEFNGISAPYEAPEKPELHVKTADDSVDECVGAIIDYLKQQGFLG